MTASIEVLLIEDDHGDAVLVRELLRESGLVNRVHHETHLEAGMRVAEQEHHDVVFLDLSLPDSGNATTLERASRLLSSRPVIVLTGNDDRELSLAAVQAGAQDFVSKNELTPNGLARAVSSAMERYALQRDRLSLLDSLRRANDELREATRLQEEFVAIASHELRTPVTVVAGMLEVLLSRWDETSDEQRQQLLEAAERNAARLTNLTEDLLTVSRIGDSYQPSRHPSLVEDIIDAAVQSTGLAASECRVEVEPGVASPVDAGRLERVLTNLLSNASRYGGGLIVVRADALDGRVRISVRDHGSGVPDAFVPRLFDNFTQASPSTTREHQGAGLGLAIVRGLVQSMAGTVSYEHADPGSRFVLDLPLAPADRVLAQSATTGR